MTDERYVAAADATSIVDLLGQLHEHGQALCPPDHDLDQWTGDVLQQLIRAAELLGVAVGSVSGERNETAERVAHALAAVVDAHRSNVMRHHKA